jgi:hypothetical protein
MLNRVSLNTIGLNRIGLNRIGKPSRGSSERPYIDPEVLASLKAVCICYGKSNDDPDRAVVKNLVDPDNPFVISNAAYTEGSGYADKDSPYYGAFVTDGIDDLITSTKSATEMLDGSNEITVVSMIHQIKTNSDVTRNNWFFTPVSYLENRVVENKTGKTGIYGYTSTNVTNAQISDITPILGDKNDYTLYSKIEDGDRDYFTVEGFQNQGIWYVSSIAWYWTIIANKVLTTDQINQVIAYFNLDRTLKPDILCDVKKQGITNENHAEFGDKLIDYSGNGRDIQLNNIAWKGDSGIGKYSADFESFDWAVNISQKQHNKATISLNGRLCNHTAIEVDEMKVNIIGNITELIYWYIANPDDTTRSEIRLTSGINTLPKSYAKDDGQTYNIGFAYISGDSEITIEQIPSHAGALCLDGVNDFGQFVGDLGLKDYTLIVDRAYQSIVDRGVPIIAAVTLDSSAPFIFEFTSTDDGNKVVAHSYSGISNTGILKNMNRAITYQSTYKYIDANIVRGNSVGTGNGLTIGRNRTDMQYDNICLYSLLLFRYSMSEFLIERQLKKHKLGTLYPNMVEFRPIIKQDDRIKNVKYYKLNETADYIDLNIGDYIPVGQRIAIVVDLEEPYKITSITSSSLTDVEIRKAGGQNYAYDILGYVTDKSPQKITMDIQVDSSLVQWNPVVESNAEYQVVDFYIDTYPAVVGNYYLISSKLRVAITTKGAADEVTSLTVNGVSLGTPSINGNRFTFNGTLPDKSPQNINIAIDEYIRFEDIVQPYPVLLRFNDENGNEVSWGGKFRVGSTITRIGNFYENNLLDGLYVVRNPKLNGNNLITPTHVVEKSMVFTCDTEYLLDNNEPKCILSPSRLRIPNSSYKILGYIPDISGHGNHGVIHNSAYAGASGANGYLQNFSGWTKASGVSSTDSVISSSNNLVAANGWIAYVTSGTVIPTFKVEISGIPINGNLRFEGSDQTLVNGVNTIQGLTTTKVSGFYISNGYDNDWSNLRIEQIGEYEGAYCLDGVDDFVTIPTVTGGKQVLMKVNWSNNTFNEILYDQRVNLDIHTFAIFNHDSDTVTGESVVAYNSKNNGNTYIDGILNSNIKASELKDIKHNITITNELVDTNNSISPIIGTNKNRDAHYAKMALYDFMLFDSISTDDKIKELNEYIGIEAKVELPPYYWDAYGKTNLDEDKNYTANLGTVKDVIEVSQPAIFAENWYDGNPEPVLSSPIINQTDYSIEVKANKMDNNFTMMLDVECDTPLPAFKAKFSMVGTAISVDLKYYINGGSKIIDVFKSGGSTEPVILDIPASERSFIYGTNTDNYPNILIEILPADNGTSYGLTNTNFAYDKMSGYGGYNLSRFDKSWSSSSNTSIKVVQRNPYDITLKKLGGNSDWEFNNTELKVISNPVSVKFKSNKNIRVTCDYHYYPVGGNSEGTPLGITSKDLIANKDAIITISPISQENIDKYNIDVNRGYYLIYFQLSSTLAVNEEVTIEMLPLYPNGLVYDGVTDYSENANIPALTDYTYIFKREFLSKTTGSASMYKGEFFANGGMAFIADYAISDGSLYGFSYRGQAKVNSLNTDKIIYGTKTSVNGSSITPNTNIDTAGLTMGKFDSYRKMVFYKLILYPKTIPLLQINFLKNLMERDEIIDLNNKIFIQE